MFSKSIWKGLDSQKGHEKGMRLGVNHCFDVAYFLTKIFKGKTKEYGTTKQCQQHMEKTKERFGVEA